MIENKKGICDCLRSINNSYLGVRIGGLCQAAGGSISGLPHRKVGGSKKCEKSFEFRVVKQLLKTQHDFYFRRLNRKEV